jgi:hypothetical protein
MYPPIVKDHYIPPYHYRFAIVLELEVQRFVLFPMLGAVAVALSDDWNKGVLDGHERYWDDMHGEVYCNDGSGGGDDDDDNDKPLEENVVFSIVLRKETCIRWVPWKIGMNLHDTHDGRTMIHYAR